MATTTNNGAPSLGNGIGGANVVATASNLNSISPISTLERQYEEPLGQRLIVLIRTNPQCCLEGGVEYILRLQQQAAKKGVAPISNGKPTNFEESADDDFDAFAFLHENDTTANGKAAANGNVANGFGGFIRKMAATTTESLARQMTGMAVRMDKGRTPDQMRVGIYDATTQDLLGVTEPNPLPAERGEVKFHIPLVVPGKRRQTKVTFKLWIQPGAVLAGISQRHYLLGAATIDCKTIPVDTVTSVPLASNIIVGGELKLCVLPDTKFAPILSRGWGLTDPDMQGYPKHLYNLPLDQCYAMAGNEPNHWLAATERATESTVVVPIAALCMDLAAKACEASLAHSKSIHAAVSIARHDVKHSSKAICNLGIVGLIPPTNRPLGASLSIHWRRPDSVFEVEILPSTNVPLRSEGAAANPAFTLQFFPRVCTTNILPGIWQACGGRLPGHGYLLGVLYFSITLQYPENQYSVLETMVGMESFVNHTGGTTQVPVHKKGQPMGDLLLQLNIQMPSQIQVPPVRPAIDDGLLSVMGLESLMEGVEPLLDGAGATPQHQTIDPNLSLRRQQLATMGTFCSAQYMEKHVAIRQSTLDGFKHKSKEYMNALVNPQNVPEYETRAPKAFRPSSSRPEVLVSGIPFNVHVASLDVSVIDANQPPTATQRPGALFHNVTHGAPSDHARGFGNCLEGISSVVNASGGLRRLEATRRDCAQALQQAQSLLIAGVGNFFGQARQSGGRVHHVPARHSELQSLRWKVFEAVHALNHLNWMCAIRRAHVFSQALGIAVTSYLTSVSDFTRCQAGWPALWASHGYLIVFEGLLSAAGKELGMIEDASVAVAMLRMVQIVLAPADGNTLPDGAVKVASSPFLQWMHLTTSGQGKNRKYVLKVGVDAQYYQTRVPAALQNDVPVQLYPILYQVGVDIRQWGANTGSNMKQQMSRIDSGGSEQSGSIVDDDDDDDAGGFTDNDVLVALNYEGLRKMNAYAHAISPQSTPAETVQNAMRQVFEHATTHPQQQQQPQPQQLPVHPSLSLLHSHIMSSAGKMNHSILDEAATLTQQFGGGGCVFCKSGKDRTAMHVTYKQAQFGARYRGVHDPDTVFADATFMRIYGTRLPICEKNVGQSKYAFNSLQVKFMPEALKPPMSTLAGFLKGGRIFGEGAIES